MKSAFLPDRGVVKVSGPDARSFLNNLVTTEVDLVRPGIARFGALLTPQGKIVVDFLITEAPEGHITEPGSGFLLDCPLPLADAFATKLGFYKLRAKVVVENLSGGLGVLAVWDGKPEALPDLAFADPRSEALGWRILVPQDLAEKATQLIGAEWVAPAAYEAHRIACGVPRGGADFGYGDAFPHETNMDHLHGVDFDKGCYVGQEVVSRMQHRGTARTRTVRITLDQAAPAAGTSILAGEKSIGTMGSSAQGKALAVIRVDRATEALDAGLALLADGQPIQLAAPDEVRAAVKKASA
ncbi:folate-binding protein [Bradyrhizobium prioriisuperbiae]|uniref:CAF17-like 4Fe-4S cluster assembly/insertion protein YgfZ n=1 Tax=Bradyrhizobium prioriisuperbiae TaxID=2854389 RepID=UPI0028E61582|nr:folate-binding protein [Bradyrhizobium prioritasuperba]